jgi:hypothetical protein
VGGLLFDPRGGQTTTDDEYRALRPTDALYEFLNLVIKNYG